MFNQNILTTKMEEGIIKILRRMPIVVKVRKSMTFTF